ncbi:MAG: hypothetical protein K9N47_18250 [Prosthecobacter sp.]|uniref:hypothetical protein n=1 Tax=Prosthecobacter sp. TaxID=1965333 RepID=UPI0025FA5F9B|nr:hypothetical protein [Prosthecobacter sp.]MCF7788070.1 hypothetical protein [Prosthecobacter sp.]
MNTSGLIVMVLSVGTAASLFSWCIYKVLTTPRETEKVHGVDLHTPDMDVDS